MNIKLTPDEKNKVMNPMEVFEIMKRILMRENRVDRNREHFWVISPTGYYSFAENVYDNPNAATSLLLQKSIAGNGVISKNSDRKKEERIDTGAAGRPDQYHRPHHPAH